MQASAEDFGSRHEAQPVVLFQELEDNNDQVLWEVLEVLPHALQLQQHIIELLFNSYLLDFLNELLDLDGALLFNSEYLWDLEKLQYLVCPHVLIDSVRFNALVGDGFVALRLLYQQPVVLGLGDRCSRGLVAVADFIQLEVAFHEQTVAASGELELAHVVGAAPRMERHVKYIQGLQT